MGFIGYGALDGIDYMAWYAGSPDTGLDAATMQQFIVGALESVPLVGPVLLVFLSLPLGLIVLAIGTVRAGVLPV